jgi:membrane peptidoglycan carboxypeptidase
MTPRWTIPDYNFQANNYHIYTTLDVNLQRDAEEAVRIGMMKWTAIKIRKRRSCT